MKLNRKTWRTYLAVYLLVGYNRLVGWLGGPASEEVNGALVRATVGSLRASGWRVVKFDPNTEAAERPIVVDEMTA